MALPVSYRATCSLAFVAVLALVGFGAGSPARAGLAMTRAGCTSNMSYRMQEDWLEACTALIDQSRKRPPDKDFETRLEARFEHYWVDNKMDLALADYEEARRVFPASASMVCTKAYRQQAEFGIGVAQSTYEEAIVLDKNNTCGYRGLFWANIDELRFNNAIMVAARASKVGFNLYNEVATDNFWRRRVSEKLGSDAEMDVFLERLWKASGNATTSTR